MVDHLEKEFYSLTFPDRNWSPKSTIQVQGIVRNYDGEFLREFVFEIHEIEGRTSDFFMQTLLDVEERYYR